jgi:hypothetical protein
MVKFEKKKDKKKFLVNGMAKPKKKKKNQTMVTYAISTRIKTNNN